MNLPSSSAQYQEDIADLAAEYRRHHHTDSIDVEELAQVRAPVGAEHGDSVNHQ